MRKILFIAACCILLAACGKGPSAGTSSGAASAGKEAPLPPAGKTVTVFMYSEYIDPALVDRFEKETGMKIVLDTYESTEEMMSKVPTRATSTT